MTKYRLDLAKKEDDSLLRVCLKENPIPGKIAISFETEPSFFDALEVQGKDSQVMVIRREDDLTGFGVRTIKKVYLDEQVEEIGYLSGLRGYEQDRKGLLLARAYRFFKELDSDRKAPFYLTTIMEDNHQAREVLEGGRAGLPPYHYLTDLITFVVKPQKKKRDNIDIIKGKSVSLEKIIDFMNQEGKKKQFYPFYQLSDFSSPRLRSLERDDFYVAIKDGEIIGSIAKWDQQAFKQTRVVDYDAKLRLVRPIINIFSRLSKIPRLPKEGEKLNFFYASFPTIKDNNPRVLESLLSSISSDEENQDYDHFTIGLTKDDPLIEALKPFKAREYKSRVYVVSFNKTKEELPLSKERIAYLELGTL